VHSLTQYIAREQSADRLRAATRRAEAARTYHPPSRVRGRAASVVARLAWRLDADAARIALK
jgi:hypothetical protein